MRTYKLFKGLIAVLAFLVCSYLLIINLVVTHALVGILPGTSAFVLDNIPLNVIAVVAVVALGVVALKSTAIRRCFDTLTTDANYNKTRRIMLWIILAIGALWSFSLYSCGQHYDSLELQNAVYGMSWGSFAHFAPTSYFGIYPNNIGTTLLYSLASVLAGSYNYLVLMLLNSVLIAFIYSDLSELLERLSGSRKLTLIFLAAGVFFLPFTGLSALVYGTIPGLFLAIRALCHIIDYSQTHSKSKAISACILISLAIIIKNNFVIFLIAFVLFLIFEALRTSRLRTIIPAAAMVCAFALSTLAVNVAVRQITGYDVQSGAAKLSWIAMGMQEDSGTYNGYNSNNLVDLNFDADAETQLAKEDIATQLSDFAAEPSYALNFYTRKAAIEWTDPLFNAFQPVTGLVYESDNIPVWVWNVLSPTGIAVMTAVYDVFLSLVYLGTAAFVICYRKEKLLRSMLPMLLIFVGGYTFHLIWEAGSTYATPYFILLVPIAIVGLRALAGKLASAKIKRVSMRNTEVSGTTMLYCIMTGVVFIIACAGLGTMRTLIATNAQDYKQYLADGESNSRDAIAPGNYIIKPADSSYDGNGIEIEITRRCSRARIEVLDSDLYLTESRDDSSVIDIAEFSYDDSQAFTILSNENSTYSIAIDGKALCYSPDEHLFGLSEFTDYLNEFNTDSYSEYIEQHPEQTWIIEEVG